MIDNGETRNRPEGDDEAVSDVNGGDSNELPRLSDLLTALAALTSLPLPRPDPQGTRFARSTLFFPLVGFVVGAVLFAVDHAIGAGLPVWLSAAVLVAAWIVAGRDWSAGATALPALALMWVLKWYCLEQVPAIRPAGLLFGPLLGRWSIVVLATGARDARRAGRKFNNAVRFREFALTSVIAGGMLLTLAQFLGLVVFAAIGAAVLALRLAVHRWIGGVSWNLLVVSSQGVELLVLLVLAFLAGHSH